MTYAWARRGEAVMHCYVILRDCVPWVVLAQECCQKQFQQSALHDMCTAMYVLTTAGEFVSGL